MKAEDCKVGMKVMRSMLLTDDSVSATIVSLPDYQGVVTIKLDYDGSDDVTHCQWLTKVDATTDAHVELASDIADDIRAKLTEINQKLDAILSLLASEVVMPFTDGHVKDGFVKLVDESEATPKKVGIGPTRCPFGSRPTLDDLTDMWNAASVETSCYTSVISQPEWRYDRRRATPFIWLLVDGAETAHIVDGVSGVYFVATAARISDDSFKWALHENKRLMRIGFSSDLKTAKEDAEKFCRERMAVHRESKETK